MPEVITQKNTPVNLDLFPTEGEKELIRTLLRNKDLHYSPSVNGDKVTLEVMFLRNEANGETVDEHRERLKARDTLAKILFGCGVIPIRINPGTKFRDQLSDETRNLAMNMKIYEFLDIVELVKQLKMTSVREILDFTSDILASDELPIKDIEWKADDEQ